MLDIIRDEHDRPVDYRFVEVNPAMERHTGWRDARGKTARELIENLEPDTTDTTDGRMALDGHGVPWARSFDSLRSLRMTALWGRTLSSHKWDYTNYRN